METVRDYHCGVRVPDHTVEAFGGWSYNLYIELVEEPVGPAGRRRLEVG
jgi:hypothetical protein